MADQGESSNTTAPTPAAAPTAAEAPRRKIKLSKNPVHNHFHAKVNPATGKVSIPRRKICDFKNPDGSLCSAELGDHASTMRKHLKEVHGYNIEHEEETARKEQESRKISSTINIPNSVDNDGTPSVAHWLEFPKQTAKKLPRSDKKQINANKALALAIGTSSVPASFTQNKFFQAFCNIMDPAVQISSRTKISSDLSKVWVDMKERIEKSVSRARRVAITGDLWTSKGLRHSFLGVTAHFVDPETKKRERYRIACHLFEGAHTGINIAQMLKTVMQEYGFETKVSSIVSDNGSNFLKAIRVLNEEENEEWDQETDHEEISADGVEEEDYNDTSETDFDQRERDMNLILNRFRRIPCFSHTSQLPIKKIEKKHQNSFCSALVKAQKLVVKYKKSPKAKEVLSQTSFKLTLTIHIDIRWFTRMHMAKSVIAAATCSDQPLDYLVTKMGWPVNLAPSLGT